MALHFYSRNGSAFGMKGLPGVQIQNESDSSYYRRDISIYRKEDVLFQLKIRGAFTNVKNQPRHLLSQFSSTLLKSIS
jgi:hypothetical protein